MPRVLHRISPNRARELRERLWAIVEAKLAGKIICPRCKGTFKTYSNLCIADLDERCPGFETIDAIVVPLEREMGLS